MASPESGKGRFSDWCGGRAGRAGGALTVVRPAHGLLLHLLGLGLLGGRRFVLDVRIRLGLLLALGFLGGRRFVWKALAMSLQEGARKPKPKL
jgi:hypothetical protein